MTKKAPHISVLLEESIDILDNSNLRGGSYLDCTFGMGGHTRALLEAGAGKVVALDRDGEAVDRAGHWQEPRLEIRKGRFSELASSLREPGFEGILVDLGPSSVQLKDERRGFSVHHSGPLDMRMGTGPTLAELLDSVSVEELAERLRVSCRNAHGLAKRLLARRQEGRLESTQDLAGLMGPRRSARHPATPLFMALRMWVNEELEEIHRGLPRLLDCLKPGGRLAVITFHSTEDRIVKWMFREWAGHCVCQQEPCSCVREKRVELVTRKPITPTDEELHHNPSARSAKLRCVEKRDVAR